MLTEIATGDPFSVFCGKSESSMDFSDALRRTYNVWVCGESTRR